MKERPTYNSLYQHIHNNTPTPTPCIVMALKQNNTQSNTPNVFMGGGHGWTAFSNRMFGMHVTFQTRWGCHVGSKPYPC